MNKTLAAASWATALLDCQQRGQAHALATVIAASGSTPRATGTKMLVTASDSVASLGGGGLEHLVINRARELLESGQDCQEVKQFALGAAARQCCGGSMTVLLECFAAQQPVLVVFGAGHVCQALVTITSALPLQTIVIDSRQEQLDLVAVKAPDVTLVNSCDPVSQLNDLPQGCEILVMTHDHQLDYQLVKQLLDLHEWARPGMIGSATKANRFRMRLRNDGISEDELARLESPIGLAGLKGKYPMEVAVSVCAALLQRFAGSHTSGVLPAQRWREIRDLMPQQASGQGG